MKNNQLFLPINNHYTGIDLPTLKSNNFISMHPGQDNVNLKRKRVNLSPVLNIAKYGLELKQDNISKGEVILNSKKIISQIINPLPKKSSYYDQINMLAYTPKRKEDLIVKNYLNSFTTLDIPLAQTQNNLYEFNSRTLNSKILNNNVYKILEYSFFEMGSVISKPYFYITPKNVIINLFYFLINNNVDNKKFLDININKLQGLSANLSRYFKKSIKFELTQLHSVINNSQILINILGKLGLSRRNSFQRITNRFLKFQSQKLMFRSNLFKFRRFASILTGVNIKLGGRLMRGKIVPRRTVKKIQYGSLARSKSNYVSTATLTQKNKRGSFSFTVSIGHKFF